MTIFFKIFQIGNLKFQKIYLCQHRHHRLSENRIDDCSAKSPHASGTSRPRPRAVEPRVGLRSTRSRAFSACTRCPAALRSPASSFRRSGPGVGVRFEVWMAYSWRKSRHGRALPLLRRRLLRRALSEAGSSCLLDKHGLYWCSRYRLALLGSD